MKTYTLSNGMTLPGIAFGTYEVHDPEVFVAAMEHGYRYFDTASFYQNEDALGEAVRIAEQRGIVSRKDLIISSKCWRSEMGYDGARTAFFASLERLGLKEMDMYLIHWPRPNLSDENWPQISRDTWRALEDLYKEGLVKAIGISNFLVHHMENLLTTATIVPMVEQLELHPGYLQKEAVDLARSKGMTILGWSPLGKNRLMQDETLLSIAARYRISVQELCLAFESACNIIPLPKTTNPDRMDTNMAAIDIALKEEDIETIRAMKRRGWSGEHPDYERVKDVSLLDEA
ncbi:MAG: aldo/keto reductase [Lachnospiraceae bacterium]|nr:aldo/keto reductase [Lachnospiraceae bacterium]